jgi:ComF family protein
MWRTLIDFCFPPSESILTIRRHPLPHLHDFYHPLPVGDTLTLASYQTPLIKACITAGKFEHNLEALRLVSTLLSHHFIQEQITNTLFVPIPLHRSRERERGYNQVTEIIRFALNTYPSAGRIEPLLSRIIATPAQSHLGRSERLKNLQSAFAYRERKIDWEGITSVVLVDDVLTTGATLEAAKAILVPNLPSHIHFICLAIAH